MINTTEMEMQAIKACLPDLGALVAQLGMQRPMASYSKTEVLNLIEVVVSAYQAYMTAEHERMAARDRTFLEQRIKLKEQTTSSARPL